MKRAKMALALLMALVLAGCVQDLGPPPETDDWGMAPQASSSQAEDLFSGESTQQSGPASSDAVSRERNEAAYPYKQEMVGMVNDVLEGYASGSLPEPMHYNSDYTGIVNSPPGDSQLPERVSLADVKYEIRYGELTDKDFIVVSVPLENDYIMDVHIDTDSNDGTGRPLRASSVYYFDMQGTQQREAADAERGGEYLNIRSDRLFASADFDNVRTDAGRVSGSISWGKANGFLWIDIDSMKSPFFYTYFVNGGGGLVQDYPQKDWQHTDVVNDEKMMAIAQSLFNQFYNVLNAADMPVGMEMEPQEKNYTQDDDQNRSK